MGRKPHNPENYYRAPDYTVNPGSSKWLAKFAARHIHSTVSGSLDCLVALTRHQVGRQILSSHTPILGQVYALCAFS